MPKLPKTKRRQNKKGEAAAEHAAPVVHSGGKAKSSKLSSKLLTLVFVAIFGVVGSIALLATHADSTNNHTLYVLYNSTAKEWFYSDSTTQKNTYLTNGYSLVSSHPYATPTGGKLTSVYQLHNPTTHDYFFTTSASYRDSLIGSGKWTGGGTGFTGALPATTTTQEPYGYCVQPWHQLYDSTTTTHRYTPYASVVSSLVNSGAWKDQGVGFNLVVACTSHPAPAPTTTTTTPTPTPTTGTTTGSTTTTTTTATYSHDPYGYLDYCKLENNETVLYGWAHDVDAQKSALPNVQVTITYGPNGSKSLTTTVPTNISGYRDAAINTWIKTYRSTQPAGQGMYGFKVTLKDLYKGQKYAPTGVVINSGQGANVSLRINTTTRVDGNSPIVNGAVPDACMITKPANVSASVGPVPVGSTITAKPVTGPKTVTVTGNTYTSDKGVYAWGANKAVTFEDNNFTVTNGSYSLKFTNDNLVESFKGTKLWDTKITPFNYPDLQVTKHGQLTFNAQGRLTITDPNVRPNVTVWKTPLASVTPGNNGYSLQLTPCGGVYVYERASNGALVGGTKVTGDNSKNDATCGVQQLGGNARLFAKTSLYVGMSLVSFDDSARVEMHPGGVFLYNHANKVLWKQEVKGANRLVMGAGGNLSLFGDGNKPLWSTNVSGGDNNYAVVDNGGYFAIKRVTTKKNDTIWSNGITAKTCTDQKMVAAYPASGDIVCVKAPAPVAGGSGSSQGGASHTDGAACKSIGSGKYNCEFNIPTPVVVHVMSDTKKQVNKLAGQFTVGTTNWILCQQKGGSVSYQGSHDDWWGYTTADNGAKGWVNAVYAKGGDDNSGFQNVPNCDGKHGTVPTGKVAGASTSNDNTPAPTPRHKKGNPSGQQSSGGKTTTPKHPCTYKDTDSSNCSDNCGSDGQTGWKGDRSGKCVCFSNGSTYTAKHEGSVCKIKCEIGVPASNKKAAGCYKECGVEKVDAKVQYKGKYWGHVKICTTNTSGSFGDASDWEYACKEFGYQVMQIPNHGGGDYAVCWKQVGTVGKKGGSSGSKQCICGASGCSDSSCKDDGCGAHGQRATPGNVHTKCVCTGGFTGTKCDHKVNKRAACVARNQINNGKAHCTKQGELVRYTCNTYYFLLHDEDGAQCSLPYNFSTCMLTTGHDYIAPTDTCISGMYKYKHPRTPPPPTTSTTPHPRQVI